MTQTPFRRTQMAASPAVAGHRPVLIAVAVAACFSAPVTLRAQPAGAQAIHGNAALSQQGNKLVVTTTNGAGTNHSAINWQSFSVPAGSTTQFNQPSVASTSINRVLGNNPSSIFGTLSSNGKLVLVGGAFGNTVLDKAAINQLASLPSLDELRAKIIAMLQTPATRIAGVLQAPAGQLARVFGAYAKKGA